MKKIFPLAFLLFGQGLYSQSKIIAGAVQDDYLRKSKKQKTAAIVLLAGSGAFMITTIAIPEGDFTGYSPVFIEEHENDDIKSAFFLAGVGSGLASIPFWIASKRNKNKAMRASTSFKMETMPFIRHASIVSQPCPAVSIRINL